MIATTARSPNGRHLPKEVRIDIVEKLLNPTPLLYPRPGTRTGISGGFSFKYSWCPQVGENNTL
ncbi:hypothetical protein AVEN_68668-1, partial [Araneus ventricosus]